MKRKILSLMLAAALALGLAVPTSAAGQTFTDVPSSYWGYADIEAVAEAGLMNGTGGGAFSPEMKVSVAQFLTLLGRLVFPDVKTEGSDWFGPYVSVAKEAKLLDGTQVDTNDVEAEISRYDMAVILRAAAKKLGVAEKSAQSSEVKDFGVIPNMYTEAVLAVYGMGLIKGDQAGNFNGSNTMMRAEVATVIMRLARTPEAKAWANLGDIVEPPRTGETVTVSIKGWIDAEVVAGARVGFYYMDGRLLGETTTATASVDYSAHRTSWSMDVTMDKADYSKTEELYYAAVIGQAKERLYGTMLETPAESATPQSIQAASALGFRTHVEVVEPEQIGNAKNPDDMQELELTGWIQYNSQGDPEKNGIGVNGVPFQLRYTEDNGATYQVVAEAVTDGKWRGSDSQGCFQLTVQVDKYTLTRYWIGEGQLYISAEATINGQKYVTHDRRTDGHATVVPVGHSWNRIFVDLVPPDRGETVDVKVYGHVIAQTAGYDSEGHLWLHSHSDTITNSTVRVYYDRQQKGIAPVLLWETNADGGVIDDIMTIDTAYYYTTGNCYVVEIEAVLDGQLCTDHRGQQKPISLDELSGTYPSTIIRRYIHSDQAFEL